MKEEAKPEGKGDEKESGKLAEAKPSKRFNAQISAVGDD